MGKIAIKAKASIAIFLYTSFQMKSLFSRCLDFDFKYAIHSDFHISLCYNGIQIMQKEDDQQPQVHPSFSMAMAIPFGWQKLNNGDTKGKVLHRKR